MLGGIKQLKEQKGHFLKGGNTPLSLQGEMTTNQMHVCCFHPFLHQPSTALVWSLVWQLTTKSHVGFRAKPAISESHQIQIGM